MGRGKREWGGKVMQLREQKRAKEQGKGKGIGQGLEEGSKWDGTRKEYCWDKRRIRQANEGRKGWKATGK